MSTTDRALVRDILDEVWINGNRGQISFSISVETPLGFDRASVLAVVDHCSVNLPQILRQSDSVDFDEISIVSPFLRSHFEETEAAANYDEIINQKSRSQEGKLNDMNLLQRFRSGDRAPTGAIRYLARELRVLTEFTSWLPTPRFISHGQVLEVSDAMRLYWQSKYPTANCTEVLAAIFHQWKISPISRRGPGKIIEFIEQKLIAASSTTSGDLQMLENDLNQILGLSS